MVVARRRLLVSLTAAALIAGGCAGGVTSAPSEGRVAAQANAVCREYDELVTRAGHNARPADVAQLLAQAQQARARIRAILTPAATHPRVGALLEKASA